MHNQLTSSLYSHPSDEFIYETIFNHNKSNNHQKTIFFFPDEVQNIIRKLSNRNAPSLNLISNMALKRCNKPTILHICHILNSCARLGFFLESWKKAAVVIISKPGKYPKSPSNYRPISLLNTFIAKFSNVSFLSHSIFTQLQRSDPNNLALDTATAQQSNCPRQYNTCKKSSKGNHSSPSRCSKSVQQDLASQFKLIALEVPIKLFNILKSFHQNRKFFVKVDNKLSSSRNINAGVPQGSRLSPQLFAIYINDLLLHPKVKVALFTNDTFLYATS